MTKQNRELKETHWRKRMKAPTASNFMRMIEYAWARYAIRPTHVTFSDIQVTMNNS